jgi:hypothetical protein
MEEPHYTRDSDVQKFASNITAWIGISGAASGFLSVCFLLGIWFGPLKELPAQFGVIVTQLQEIKANVLEYKWQLENQKTRTSEIAAQLNVAMQELAKSKDDIRKVESAVRLLESTSLSKVDFIEWKWKPQVKEQPEPPVTPKL